MYCRYCYRIIDDNTKYCPACGKEQKKNPRFKPSIRIGLFFGTFMIYHIIFSSFFSVDENNVLQAPDWYMYIGFLLGILVAYSDKLSRLARPKVTETASTTPKKIIDSALVPQSNSQNASKQPSQHPKPIEGLSLECPLLIEQLTHEITSENTQLADCSNQVSYPQKDDNNDCFASDSANLEICSEETIDVPENESVVEPALAASVAEETQTVKIASRKAFTHDDLLSKFGGVEYDLLNIDLMEGREFERWCCNALEHTGFMNVKVTPASGDQGVDILAQKDGIKYAIQCKRYSHDLGNKPVQEVHAGKTMYNCHVGVVITNQHFTIGAKELAAATGVLLWDRDWITNYLKQKRTAPTTSLQSAVTPKYERNIRNGVADSLDEDEMLPAAVDIILETGQASVSMIQRHLKLGYARAARIVDEMEEKGIVGPFQGSHPRAILITKEEWQFLRSEYE